MIDNIVPFITDSYTEYDILVNIYELLFIYCFVMICFKILTFLLRKNHL